MTVEQPFLEVTKPDGNQYQIPLDEIISAQNSDEVYISIGRQASNHISLSDPHKTISRHHCSLQYKNNCWWIVDHGSANGTFIQREIDQPEIDVRSEDQICLRSGDNIMILGELTSEDQTKFWQLEFIDPEETNYIPNKQAIHTIEYSLYQQRLFRQITRRRESVSLGEQQRSLIDYMCRKNHNNNLQPTICEYDELIQAVWKDDSFGRDKRDITHLVWRIRDKIELDSGEPKFLKTVKGRGYCLDINIIDCDTPAA